MGNIQRKVLQKNFCHPGKLTFNFNISSRYNKNIDQYDDTNIFLKLLKIL